MLVSSLTTLFARVERPIEPRSLRFALAGGLIVSIARAGSLADDGLWGGGERKAVEMRGRWKIGRLSRSGREGEAGVAAVGRLLQAEILLLQPLVRFLLVPLVLLLELELKLFPLLALLESELLLLLRSRPDELPRIGVGRRGGGGVEFVGIRGRIARAGQGL